MQLQPLLLFPGLHILIDVYRFQKTETTKVLQLDEIFQLHSLVDMCGLFLVPKN